MEWFTIVLNIVGVIVLIGSFVGGIKDGATKAGVNLIVTFIAIYVAGSFYHLLALALSFLPGENWENFIAFFICIGIASAILQLILWIPRKIIGKLWSKGTFFRLIGGILGIVNAAIGLALLAIVLLTYPILDFLVKSINDSVVFSTLATAFGFITGLLPEVFRGLTVLTI
ncbi:CvpA family protein [Chloroflexota bacterium]